jgi:hypothetical protein
MFIFRVRAGPVPSHCTRTYQCTSSSTQVHWKEGWNRCCLFFHNRKNQKSFTAKKLRVYFSPNFGVENFCCKEMSRLGGLLITWRNLETSAKLSLLVCYWAQLGLLLGWRRGKSGCPSPPHTLALLSRFVKNYAKTICIGLLAPTYRTRCCICWSPHQWPKKY